MQPLLPPIQDPFNLHRGVPQPPPLPLARFPPGTSREEKRLWSKWAAETLVPRIVSFVKQSIRILPDVPSQDQQELLFQVTFDKCLKYDLRVEAVDFLDPVPLFPVASHGRVLSAVKVKVAGVAVRTTLASDGIQYALTPSNSTTVPSHTVAIPRLFRFYESDRDKLHPYDSRRDVNDRSVTFERGIVSGSTTRPATLISDERDIWESLTKSKLDESSDWKVQFRTFPVETIVTFALPPHYPVARSQA